LFVIASKSFTTLETLSNAATARDWLRAGGCGEPGRQMLAVTANPTAAVANGIPDDRIFRLWDWVGGRYSIWSAVGLPLAAAIGMDGFREFLDGAHRMDAHFRNSTLEWNIPV